ncbi:CYTH domain-containing protein, partial [Mycobacterium avium]|uniref:CYTH domain-containing protein n=1 Tax=Mycobacterium avium TaxID=1764 RepID=UPI00293BCFC7
MPAQAPQTSRHLEVERKFDVVESTVMPSFEGIAAVARVEQSPTQILDATYFDTPAHDLARNKITLRRRTGGSDAGWHLKLPAGPDARTEVRAPLDASDADTVPTELVDVVLAIVRNRPLRPVARITTERDTQVLYDAAGQPLAEFSNDHVTAWATPSAPEGPDDGSGGVDEGSGGFDDTAGMTSGEELAPDEADRAMVKQATWKRVAVLFAGPGANFVICLVLLYAIALIWGLPNRHPPTKAIVGETACVAPEVAPGKLADCTGPGPAALAGIRPGDV